MSAEPKPDIPPAAGLQIYGGPTLAQQELSRSAANVQLLGTLAITLGICIPVGGLVAGIVALTTLGKARLAAEQLGDKDALDKIATGQTCAIVGLVIATLNMIVMFIFTVALQILAS